MWAAFRSDLKEFVTSVSEDTTSALSQIDARLQDSTNSDDDGDDNYDEAIIDTDDESSHNHENDDEESTTTTPMKKKTADNDAIMLSPGGGVVMADDGVGGGYEATGVIANASDEIARRRCDEETFTLELPDTDEAKEFLSHFDAADTDTTNRISRVLHRYPTTVGRHFTHLVPTHVSYEQFWARFYYRCGDDYANKEDGCTSENIVKKRIENEWEEKRRRRRDALMKNAREGINRVGNFMGNALHAVVGDVSHDDGEDDNSGELRQRGKTHVDNAGGQGRGSILGLGGFITGSGGRPPFVLQSNDDDDDDDNDGGEEGSDEELGWDDEDEEEVENRSRSTNNEAEASEEIVEFDTDEGTSMDQQLHLAQVEMKQLRQTIERQQKEIEQLESAMVDANKRKLNDDVEGEESEGKSVNSLQRITATSEQHHINDESDGKPECEGETSLQLKGQEIEKLEMLVFEKDSEIAALKARLDDNDEHCHDGDGSDSVSAENSAVESLKQEIESLKATIAERDAEVARLQQQQQQDAENTVKEDKAKDMELTHLKEQLFMYSSSDPQNSDNDFLKADLQRRLAEAEQATVSAEETMRLQQSTLDDARTAIDQLQSELDTSQRRLDDKSRELDSVRKELDLSTIRLQQLEKHIEMTEGDNVALTPSPLAGGRGNSSGGTHEKSHSPESSLSSAVIVKGGESEVGSCRSISPVQMHTMPPIERGFTDKKNEDKEGDDEEDWGDSWGEEDDSE